MARKTPQDEPVKNPAGLKLVKKRKKDRRTRDKLILANRGLANTIARKIQERLPPFILLEDCIGEAYIGLVNAAERYDPSTNVPFSAYARLRIAGAVIDSVRRRHFKHTSTYQLYDRIEEGLKVYSYEPFEETDREIDEARRAKLLASAIHAVPDPVERKFLELRYLTRCKTCPDPEDCPGCAQAGMTGKESGKVLRMPEPRSSEVHRKAIESFKRETGRLPNFGEMKRAA